MRYELTGEEWTAIKPMLPNKPRGVPRVNDRRVLNGIFWVLRSWSTVARLANQLRSVHGLLQSLRSLATSGRLGRRSCMRFLRIEPPHLIEMDRGADTVDDRGRFRVLVTFDAQGDGKTVVTLRQPHPTKAQLRLGPHK